KDGKTPMIPGGSVGDFGTGGPAGRGKDGETAIDGQSWRPSPQSYAIPAMAQAGRPIAVKGPFDGNFATTAIKIANQSAEVLAEPPRQVIAKAPAGLTGPAKIQVMKRDQVVAERDIIAVGVRLSAAKLNLIRGETTTMTVSVLGGESAKVPIFVNVVNQSPWVVRMEGGQRQRLTVDPAQFKGGAATMQRTLTGLRAGGFAITAVVEQAGYGVGGATVIQRTGYGIVVGPCPPPCGPPPKPK